MFRNCRAGREGFTLIELLVVILIIGILIAVAAPSFLGQQNKAYDSKAKQYLAIAYKQAKAVAADNDGSFISPAAVRSVLQTGEPEFGAGVALSTSDTEITTIDTVYVVNADPQGNLLLADRSKSGRIFWLQVTGNAQPVIDSAAAGPAVADWTGDTGAGWTQLSPALSPPARERGAFAVDPLSNKLLLFGGSASNGYYATNDTWKWTGTNWQQDLSARFPPCCGRPGETIEAAIGPDPVSGKLIIFGGYGDIDGGYGNPAGNQSETYSWQGSGWNIESTTGPSARRSAVIALDPVTNKLIMFGGQTSSGVSNETWRWNGSSWVQLSPAHSPPARTSAVMAADPVSGQILLFGGFGTSCGPCGDTWSWSGSDWIQLNPSQSPSGRDMAALVEDPQTQRLILFGGRDSGPNSGYLNETWEWNGTTWIKLTPANSPPARYGPMMGADPVSGRLVMFGGYNHLLAPSGAQSDTWSYNGGALPDPPAALSAPTLSGNPYAGQQFSATSGTWLGHPSAFGYQWRRCDSAGANCSDINGATSQNYTPTGGDIGKTLRVRVIGSNAGGDSSPQTSAASGAVTNPQPPVNTSVPTVTGPAMEAYTETAGNGSWSNGPTSFSYQWRRCDSGGANCSDISGANAQTYSVASADVGYTLRVRVNASNAGGSNQAVSGPSPVVQAYAGGGS